VSIYTAYKKADKMETILPVVCFGSNSKLLKTKNKMAEKARV